MKNILYTLSIILLILCSCEKSENNLPASNIKGVWLGTWQTDDKETRGSFLAPVNQDGNSFSGNVFIRFQLPDVNDSYAPEYFGRINGNEIKVSMDISGIDIKVNGTVTDETTVEGRFDVVDVYSGSFSGIKYPMADLAYETVYTIENTVYWHNKILAIDENIWIYNLELGEFVVVSESGEKKESVDLNFYFNDIVSDGSNLWVYGMDNTFEGNWLKKVNVNGELMDSIIIKEDWPAYIAVDNETVFSSSYTKRQIYKYNPQGVIQDSTIIDYITIGSFIANSTNFLICGHSSPYIFRIDNSGKLLQAYALDKNIIGITKNNNDEVFCLTNEVIFGANRNSYTYNVIKLKF